MIYLNPAICYIPVKVKNIDSRYYHDTYFKELNPEFHQPDIHYLRKFNITPVCQRHNGLAALNF
jgi:hypothetical protein